MLLQVLQAFSQYEYRVSSLKQITEINDSLIETWSYWVIVLDKDSIFLVAITKYKTRLGYWHAIDFIFHKLNISTTPGIVVSQANLYDAKETGTLIFISLGSLTNPVDLTESWGI